ncbi:CCDC159 isoform 18 [Pan troglodytes]|uniref:Coiled-coil domain containing 159 n=3 Tax=Hominidae TaxID=9604 RepID=K7EKR4_HUMAN|nr:CCDC159 isoform 8 [Pan troglodytes]PNI51426.1 CCDC159 isoform 18 [Pan troglodytes]PNJ14279.1 CCDC159 isoform 7 [Pongo abelii]PNJ14284.1 CCDC159 isoform 17 [Pongo abelii]
MGEHEQVVCEALGDQLFQSQSQDHCDDSRLPEAPAM